MTELNFQNNQDEYDTTINVIGGLRDIGFIYKAIESYFSEGDSLGDLISGRNELNLRTERSRKRIQKAINVAFLTFKNQDHKDLFQSYFIREELLPDRELLVFWQFSLSNRLFREITTNVFVKAYFSGRTGLPNDDITAYVKELLSQNKQLNINWSENTIHMLSTKYLNLMTNLNFLEGARIKSFKYIRISDESLVLFLYFLRLQNPANRNIYKNAMLPLSFVNREDILERLKKLSIKGYFGMDFNGVDLNIALTQSYKGICDALYNKS